MNPYYSFADNAIPFQCSHFDPSLSLPKFQRVHLIREFDSGGGVVVDSMSEQGEL